MKRKVPLNRQTQLTLFGLFLIFVLGIWFVKPEWIEELKNKVSNQPSEYHITQHVEGEWQKVAQDEFPVQYESRSYQLRSAEEIKVRIVHRGGDFADVEQMRLEACGATIDPEYGRYVEDEKDILSDLLEDDHNVVIAQNKEIEMSWQMPTSCLEEPLLSLKANAYPHSSPFYFDGNNIDRVMYKMDSNIKTLDVDGLIDEVDGIDEPNYSPLWSPSTGHPDGETHIYVSNDDEYIYFSFDITMDNTDEQGEDWLELTIKKPDRHNTEFIVRDDENKFGVCGFGLTSKVNYKHQTCEMKIPRKVVQGDEVDFSVRYYGTGGSPERSRPVFPENFTDDEYISSQFDTTVFSAHFRNVGGSDSEISQTNFADRPTYALDHSESSNDNLIVYGEDQSVTGLGYLLRVASVDFPGGTVNWRTTLVDRSDDVGDFGVSKVIQIIQDDSDGAFVLYVDGDITPASEAGNVRLAHLDDSGVLTALDTFGWYNADMVKGNGSSVIVLYDMGAPGPQGGTNRHGFVRRYTSAGMDGAFGTVSVSSDAVSLKSGAVMIPDAQFVTSQVWIFWLDGDATSPGVYLQRINTSGSVLGSARGDRIYDTGAGGFSTTEFLRASTGFSFDSKYVAYLNGSSDWIIIDINSAGSGRNWVCAQNFGPAEAVGLAHEEGISGAPRGIFVVGLQSEELRVELYDQADGDTAWATSPQIIDDDTNLLAVLQNRFFPTTDTTTRVDASGVAPDQANGVDLAYSKGATEDNFFVNFERSTYGAGAGGDCTAGSPPDAITDLVAVAGDAEVDLGWTAPADNGSAITDYQIDFREFPSGTFSTFVDGVSTSTSATVTGLTNGQAYEFRVFAINGIGTSATSNLAQTSPLSLTSGRRLSETGGPQFFLGRVRDESDSPRRGALRGSARVSDVEQLLGERFQSAEGDEGIRSLANDQELIQRLGRDRTELLQLIDLIIALRRLYQWTSPQNYELIGKYHALAVKAEKFFLTRFFHHLIGVEYLKRGNLSTYAFDYKNPVDSETKILVDFARSTLLTVGRACYDPSVLDYAEELDYPDSPNWYVRYVEVLRPWFEEFLGSEEFALIRPMDDVKVLDAYYLLLFGFCLGEELGVN